VTEVSKGHWILAGAVGAAIGVASCAGSEGVERSDGGRALASSLDSEAVVPAAEVASAGSNAPRYTLARSNVVSRVRGVASPAPDAGTRLSPRPIIDRQGFGSPIEAYSVLVPDGWSFESEVVWLGPGGRCGPGYAQPVFLMESPDGSRAIEVALGVKAELTAVDLDPSTANSPFAQPYIEVQRQTRAEMEAKSREYQTTGPNCQVGRPTNHRDFVERSVVSAMRPDSRIVGLEPDPAIRAMLQPLEATGAEMRAMSSPGMQADQTIETTKLTLEGTDARGRPSVEILKFGTVVQWLTSVFEGLTPDGMRMVHMGQLSVTSHQTTWITAYRAPKGELADFEPLVGAIMASLRANPRWQAAFNQFLANITRIQNQGAMERSRIMAETQNSISDMQMEGWRRRQDSQDRSAKAFVNSIRGVEQRIDPSTGFVVDVPNTGYEYYSDGQGNILIIDTPGVEPHDLFPDEDWQVMRRPD